MPASDVYLSTTSGARIGDGVLNNLFPDGSVGDGATYALFELRNTGTGSFSGGKLWLQIDAGGGTFALAIANGTPQANGSSWAPVTTSGLTYSSPASSATGLTIPTLSAGQKVLCAAKRDLTGAAAKSPEVNKIIVTGTVPLGF